MSPLELGWYVVFPGGTIVEMDDLKHVTVAIGPFEMEPSSDDLCGAYIVHVSSRIQELKNPSDSELMFMSLKNYERIRDNVLDWARWCSKPLDFLEK